MIFALKDQRSIQVISIFASKISDLPKLCFSPVTIVPAKRLVSLLKAIRSLLTVLYLVDKIPVSKTSYQIIPDG